MQTLVENFPLKQDYFKLYSVIKEDFFKSLANPKKVIKWHDGWYFLGDNYSDNLSESKGLLLFTKKELEILKENLKFKKEWSKANNMVYIMAIAPNKESVYGNLLPITQYGNVKKMSQVDSLCKILNIPYIDLGKQIPNKDKTISYHKTDTHWNYYGAYFGYKEFMEKMNSWYPALNLDKPFALQDYNLTHTWNKEIGDLKEMSSELRGENVVELNLKTGTRAIQIENKITPADNIVVNPSEYEIRFKTNTGNRVKVLFIHDSFAGALLKFIKEHFGESVFVFHRDFDKNLLKIEKPNILVEEIVEREVDVLLLDKFLNKEFN